MTLKEHYKFHSRKSLKPYVSLFLLIALCISVFHTFARYSNVIGVTSGIHVAKWIILINNEQISSGTGQLSQPINLLNADNGTNKIDQGDECYFDITINPSLTEVSISYEISLDLSAQGNTLPQGTKIEKYEKYTGSSSVLVSTTNVNATSYTITDDINLQNSQAALGETDIVKYRIYCVLPDHINVQKDDEFSVIPRIAVKQKINNN